MAKNSRPSIKNEEQYDALIAQGYSQKKAARIANTPDAGKKGAKPKTMRNAQKMNFTSKPKK
jgi:hypothetical protein